MQLSAPWEALEPSRAAKLAADVTLDSAQQAVQKAHAYGKVIVTGNYRGRIQVLENLARPKWL